MTVCVICDGFSRQVNASVLEYTVPVVSWVVD